MIQLKKCAGRKPGSKNIKGKKEGYAVKSHFQ
jgi:hypothetical protein